MKLISMTDFVLSQTTPDWLELCEFEENSYKIYNYANFLKQPLELWMFLPCDDDGNVLEEPELYTEIGNCDELDVYNNQVYEYEKAKDRCLFICNSINIRQIENLIKLKITIEQFNHEVELTPTAIKQIGL